MSETAMVSTIHDRVLAAIEYAKETRRIASMRDIPRAVKEANLGEMSDGYMGTLTTRLRQNPNVGDADKLRLIALVCGVEPNWLIWEQGEMVGRGVANAARERVARSTEVVPEKGGQESLERVIDAFDWPAGMTPEAASTVIRQARQSAFKASEMLPEKYWHGELTRLVREHIGTAKSVHGRPSATPTSSLADEESPELAEHRRQRATTRTKTRARK